VNFKSDTGKLCTDPNWGSHEGEPGDVKRGERGNGKAIGQGGGKVSAWKSTVRLRSAEGG